MVDETCQTLSLHNDAFGIYNDVLQYYNKSNYSIKNDRASIKLQWKNVSCQHGKTAMIYYAAVSTSRKEGVNINLGLPPVPSRSAQFSFVSVFVNSFVTLKLRKCALQAALL